MGITPPSHAITIEQAWEASKAYDPSYQKAQIDTQISETGIRSSRSNLLPGLSANANSNWSENGENTNGYSVTLSQTIWDSSKWSGLEASEASFASSQLKERQAHNDLAEKLVTAYLNLAKAQGDFRLAKQKLDEGQKVLKITEQRYAAGGVMATEVEDMRANHVDEQALILQVRSDIDTLQAALMALIGQLPDSVDEISITSLKQPPMLVSSEKEWLALARNNSPELLAAQQTLKASQYRYDQARAGYYPTIEGSLSYSDNDRRNHDDLSAGLTLNIPIDLNGATRANVDRSSLSVNQARQDIRIVEINIKQSIQSRFNQLQLDWQRVEMAQQQIASREKALKSKQAVYDAGLVDATDVITAHNNLFSSKNNLQALLYQYWQHRVSLLQSVGKLDDDTITQISRALES
ncbi:TolC family protein [Photobacterium sp. SDRW27]|uniref:TolC family protein n=1 Tax=Photobacterium obscurum TaxID=2829490 RepID=UPI00224329FA|nr:TolC family protein [Photobacterium obscurum]MCW8328772.1 TolC family protein [Photobacterium obscurum]